MFHDINEKYSEILLVYKYKNGEKVVFLSIIFLTDDFLKIGHKIH